MIDQMMSPILYQTILEMCHEHGAYPDDNGFFRRIQKGFVGRSDRVPLSSIVVAIEELLEKTGKPELSLSAAQVVPISALGSLGFSFVSSANLREALGRLERYHKLVSQDATVGVSISDSEVQLVMRRDIIDGPVKRFATEAAFSLIVRLMRTLVGERLMLTTIRFEHHITSLSPYEGHFGCVVTDSEPLCSRLTFPARYLDIPVRPADHQLELLDFLEAQLQQRLIAERTRRNDGFVHELHDTILALMVSGEVTAERAARMMSTSRRSLYRALAARGLSFGRVVGSLRHRLAKRYLEEGKSPKEVAFLLGYSEYSSFARAFRRWTGYTVSGRSRAPAE